MLKKKSCPGHHFQTCRSLQVGRHETNEDKKEIRLMSDCNKKISSFTGLCGKDKPPSSHSLTPKKRRQQHNDCRTDSDSECSSVSSGCSSDTSSPPSPAVIIRNKKQQTQKILPQLPTSPVHQMMNRPGRRGRPLGLDENEQSFPSTIHDGLVRILCDGPATKKVIKRYLKASSRHHSDTSSDYEKLLDEGGCFRDTIVEEKSNSSVHTFKKAVSHGKYHKRFCCWHVDPKHPKYQSHCCNLCKKDKKKQTNCYCTCNVARWMCYDCFCDHIVSVAKKVGANRSTTDAAAHRLLTAPNHSRTYDEQTDCWIKTNKDKYQKYNCHTCKNCRIRTYCSCQPGVWMCPGCHQKHVLAFCTNNSFPT